MVNSPTPPASETPDLGPRSSPNSIPLAFLVHSPETVQNNLPPDVDNKPLARQRRRRTSKEDEEVLKAEYKRNPKPDKAARMEIVCRVALGEKEVQIWFQNKRQNDRRRSRPADSSDFDHQPVMSSSSLSDLHAQEEEVEPTIQPESTAKTESQTTDNFIPSTDPRSFETVPTELSSSQPLPSSQDATRPQSTYLANRRSASFIRYGEEELAGTTDATSPTEQPTRTMKRAHSFVRLSMTADGKARVITDADSSPSPPRQRPVPSTFANRAATLRRSYSAAGLNDRLLDAKQGPSPKMPRTAIGRSRDSRAWEFYCDPESRNTLTMKAEQEGSGSAADAIGLIRANSKAALKSNQSKRNMPILGKHDTNSASSKDVAKKARRFQRASTTYGRLQTDAKLDTATSEKPQGKQNADGEWEVLQTESDKENWSPEPTGQSASSQAWSSINAPSQDSRRVRKILGENTEIMSQSTSLGSMLSRERGRISGEAKKVNPEEDEEIAAFMGSGSRGMAARTNLSSGEELGCVEGLLALSQGNWR